MRLLYTFLAKILKHKHSGTFILISNVGSS